MSIETRLIELKDDLLKPEGPAISTNRNYPFALFQYSPNEEFVMRSALLDLLNQLRGKGWTILNVDLLETFLEFLREQEEGALLDALIMEEKIQYEAYKKDFHYPLHTLHNSLNSLFKDEIQFPKKVLQKICDKTEHSDENRSVIFLSRIGGLYPFYRTSSLLRFLDKGSRIPTIILYPGERREGYFLSFMGEMEADRDYRPRIY